MSAVADGNSKSVRSRAARWAELRDLLNRVDAMVTANAHIDALSLSGVAVVTEVAIFEKDLQRVWTAVLREQNRLTADGLRADLQKKREKK